jgi:hypothetical protein
MLYRVAMAVSPTPRSAVLEHASTFLSKKAFKKEIVEIRKLIFG